MLEEQFEGFVIKQIFTIILIHENEIFTNVHIICEILHRQDVEKISLEERWQNLVSSATFSIFVLNTDKYDLLFII